MAFWSSIVLASSALILSGCAAHAGLPQYASIPDFTLTDQTGAAFSSASQLKGHIWIADFIFTNCTGPCPRMSSQMHHVQTGLAGVDGVRLVSFTVDPDRDTPPVLAAYASRFEAKPGTWFFLTGPRDSLHQLSRNAFMLGDVDGNLQHSTRIVLVDRSSKIRGFYLTSEDDAIPRLIADAKSLTKEKTDVHE
jgi:protein SCO1/2